jgi:hypothetical protein
MRLHRTAGIAPAVQHPWQAAEMVELYVLFWHLGGTFRLPARGCGCLVQLLVLAKPEGKFEHLNKRVALLQENQ